MSDVQTWFMIMLVRLIILKSTIKFCAHLYFNYQYPWPKGPVWQAKYNIEKAIIKLKLFLCVNLFKHRIEIMMLGIPFYSILFLNLSKIETIHTNCIMIY